MDEIFKEARDEGAEIKKVKTHLHYEFLKLLGNASKTVKKPLGRHTPLGRGIIKHDLGIIIEAWDLYAKNHDLPSMDKYQSATRKHGSDDVPNRSAILEDRKEWILENRLSKQMMREASEGDEDDIMEHESEENVDDFATSKPPVLVPSKGKRTEDTVPRPPLVYRSALAPQQQVGRASSVEWLDAKFHDNLETEDNQCPDRGRADCMALAFSESLLQIEE